ncbi:discoidin domain-containing protein [Streptomyces sp. x-19]|uniref:discoidin domain-containing protein n=1 Tax=Streptomyces sp. x-19 TaxID=2789280 RepID=UPI00397F0BCB
MEVHALTANELVRKDPYWGRWQAQFANMIDSKDPAEPTPWESKEQQDDPNFEGVHVRWQLPEALVNGLYNETSGETEFPLVPNRWLVVRYARVKRPFDQDWGPLTAAGWIIHSDYIATDYTGNVEYPPDGGYPEKTPRGSFYLSPRANPAEENPDLHQVRVGRVQELLPRRPWQEPGAEVPLFLTAVGPGLPGFSSYAPYQDKIFGFQDVLTDLKNEADAYPPQAQLSYCVLGWYSQEDQDILHTAADIPGLLPPDASWPGSVLSALGWAVADVVPESLERTLYHGTALGVQWKQDGPIPVSEKPSDPREVQVAFGQSSAEALGALPTPSGDARTGRLLQALYHGTLDTFDGPDGEEDLDEVTRRSWFSHQSGGHTWQVVPQPTQDGAPVAPPEQPDWLHELNAKQATYDRETHRLAHVQWRLWSVYWLKDLPTVPDEFHEKAPALLEQLSPEVVALQEDVTGLREQIPHGDTPDELQASIDEFTSRPGHTLPEGSELRRTPRQPFHYPSDPAIVLTNTGSHRPLARDPDDPLPCRLAGDLLTGARIGEGFVPAPPAPLEPPSTLVGLPATALPLLSEFQLLDQAVRTPASNDETALDDLIKDEGLADGLLPEYLARWQQPWLPMYLEWDIRYCAVPYHDDNGYNWALDKTPGEDSYRYHWLKSGAEAGSDSEGNLRFNIFKNRAFLAPSAAYIMRNELKRYITTWPQAAALDFSALNEALTESNSVLSQNLDGFNDWLLQRSGLAQLAAPPQIAALTGDDNHSPAPPYLGEEHFQPVRAGYFYVRNLRIVDQFGRTFEKVSDDYEADYFGFEPHRALSVRPEHDLYEGVHGPQRYLTLPPYILQPTRVRLEPPEPSTTGYGNITGWLMHNHIDRTLMVYAPDGSPLGELRENTTPEGPKTEWYPLPHAPYAHPREFASSHPDLADFLLHVLSEQPDSIAGAFRALLDVIDNGLSTTLDTAAQADSIPARLTGRPVALVHTTLGLDLADPPVNDSSWDETLQPPSQQPHIGYLWPIRLGSPNSLTDGLIGYYSDPTTPGRIDYTKLRTDHTDSYDTYLTPIGNGKDLELPARPPEQPQSRRLAILAAPHTAIHAITDILPIHAFTLDADAVHQALTRIRASFRLVSLLAPARASGQLTADTTMDTAEPHTILNILDNSLATFYRSQTRPEADRDSITLDLGDAHTITRIDAYPGTPDGRLLWPETILEYAIHKTSAWVPLANCPPQQEELHYSLPENQPVTARYVRLRILKPENHTDPVALRAFTATTTPPHHHLVMPQPSARHGTWHWAQPTPDDPARWTELPLTPADTQAHPDDPLPTARTGYLQLTPPTDTTPT